MVAASCLSLHTHRLRPRPPTPPPPLPPAAPTGGSPLPSERATPATLHWQGSETGEHQPLAAPLAGALGASAAPAEPRVSGRPWRAMIYCTAVPVSGASRARAATAGRAISLLPASNTTPDTNSRSQVPPHREWSQGTPHTPGCERERFPERLRPASSPAPPPPPCSPPAGPPWVVRPQLRGRPQSPQTEMRGREPLGSDSPNQMHLHFLCNVLQVPLLEPVGIGAHDHQ